MVFSLDRYLLGSKVSEQCLQRNQTVSLKLQCEEPHLENLLNGSGICNFNNLPGLFCCASSRDHTVRGSDPACANAREVKDFLCSQKEETHGVDGLRSTEGMVVNSECSGSQPQRLGICKYVQTNPKSSKSTQQSFLRVSGLFMNQFFPPSLLCFSSAQKQGQCYFLLLQKG